ncbi:hypothetical protein vBPeaSP1_050 [Pelagibaca phage vB_PeaS-P1]|nr:hypothetical protein vBPeaSP1_050 [Pelagibaca phage vB_PeaS-P1]
MSTYALGDGKRLRLYRKGKADMTTARLAKTIRWFSENWPADLEWPQDIPRPSKSKPQEAA